MLKFYFVGLPNGHLEFLHNQTTSQVDGGSLIDPKTELNIRSGALYACSSMFIVKNRVIAEDIHEIIINGNSLECDAELSPEADTIIGMYLKKDLNSGNPSAAPKKKIEPVSPLDVLKSNPALAPPDFRQTGFYVDKDVWYFLIWSYMRKNQVLLVGDAGTGKTSLPKLVVAAINNRQKKYAQAPIDIHYFDMMTSNPEAEFKGGLRVADGKTFFQYSRFSKVIQSPGLSVLNEINRGTKQTQNIFMSVLDDQRTLFIEKGDDFEKIQVHDNHTFFATANIGSRYTGTTSIDPAVARRFDYVELVYPPKDEEAKVLEYRTGVGSREAVKIVEVLNKIRENKNIFTKVSTADGLKIAQKVHAGYTLPQAFDFTISYRFDSDLVDGGERGILKSILTAL